MNETDKDQSIVTKQPSSEFVDYRPPTDGAQNEVCSSFLSVILSSFVIIIIALLINFLIDLFSEMQSQMSRIFRYNPRGFKLS